MGKWKCQCHWNRIKLQSVIVSPYVFRNVREEPKDKKNRGD